MEAPNECPDCGSEKITAGLWWPEGYVPVTCDDCDVGWLEMYSFTGITCTISKGTDATKT